MHLKKIFPIHSKFSSFLAARLSGVSVLLLLHFEKKKEKETQKDGGGDPPRAEPLRRRSQVSIFTMEDSWAQRS